MGCDGGTIPKRDELVKLRKKPEQVIACVRIYFQRYLRFRFPVQIITNFQIVQFSFIRSSEVEIIFHSANLAEHQ